MDPRLELVAQTARSHNISRNRRLLRVFCLVHVLCGRGFIGRGALARRRAAPWNEPAPGDPVPIHGLPCALEIPVRGGLLDVTAVCEGDLYAPEELDEDEGLAALFHTTDAGLEDFEGDTGLCTAFEQGADRAILDSLSAPSFRANPLTVENAFRRYAGSALLALAEAREAIGEPGAPPGESDRQDGPWPEPGSDAFRRLQRVLLHGYEATLVSTGVTGALIGSVQAWVTARFRT